MFESVTFLCSYLPQHFRSLFIQAKSSYSPLDLKFINDLQKFILMVKQLFSGITNVSTLLSFLIAFFLDKSDIQKCRPILNKKIEGQKQFIITTFGQANYEFTKALTLFVLIDLLAKDTCTQSLSVQEKDDYENRFISLIVQVLQKLRFEIQALAIVQGIQSSVEMSFNYDSCMQQLVIFLTKKWKIRAETTKKLCKLFNEQQMNLCEKKKREILSILQNCQDTITISNNQIQIKNPGIISPMKIQSQSKKLYINSKKKSSALQQILKTKKNCQNKKINSPIRQKQHLIQKNICDYATIHKYKPISKPRTIHQSRKNVFVRRISQNSLNFDTEKFQRNTQNSMDFIYGLSNYQNSCAYIQNSNDWNCDDQGLLVRSTPKPVRFAKRVEAISRKINFNQE